MKHTGFIGFILCLSDIRVYETGQNPGDFHEEHEVSIHWKWKKPYFQTSGSKTYWQIPKQ